MRQPVARHHGAVPAAIGRGGADTLTVYVFSKVRSGITPTINALAVIMISVTILAAILYELRRRRQERLMAAMAPPEE